MPCGFKGNSLNVLVEVQPAAEVGEHLLCVGTLDGSPVRRVCLSLHVSGPRLGEAGNVVDLAAGQAQEWCRGRAVARPAVASVRVELQRRPSGGPQAEEHADVDRVDAGGCYEADPGDRVVEDVVAARVLAVEQQLVRLLMCRQAVKRVRLEGRRTVVGLHHRLDVVIRRVQPGAVVDARGELLARPRGKGAHVDAEPRRIAVAHARVGVLAQDQHGRAAKVVHLRRECDVLKVVRRRDLVERLLTGELDVDGEDDTLRGVLVLLASFVTGRPYNR